MASAHTITARKTFTCQGYRCGRTIQAGEDYARHVAFPGDDAHSGMVPWVLKICQPCHTEYGAEMPARPRRNRAGRPSGGDDL